MGLGGCIETLERDSIMAVSNEQMCVLQGLVGVTGIPHRIEGG